MHFIASHCRPTRLVAIAMTLLLCGCGSGQADYPSSYGTMGNLAFVSGAQSRSVSPENFTGEKGAAGMATTGGGQHAARDLGQGWKVSPFVRIDAKSTFVMANVNGSGCIEHIWMTPTGDWRDSVLRIYWDGESEPSVECPIANFFAVGTGQYAQINSLAVCVNPGSGLNCYWRMPFHKSARITLENTSAKQMTLYYQVDYSVAPLPATAAYFHAQFRRESPLKEKGIYTILDGVKGKGQYVGTYLLWQPHRDGWWGEGEIKFYIDGDTQFPTICGTGTEDYFCGAYNFENPHTHKYQLFSTPYTGLAQVLPPDQREKAEQQFSLYRWHITDPIRFDGDLKVTIQDLGWQADDKYLQLQDSISSVAFWYQTEPHTPFPALPELH